MSWSSPYVFNYQKQIGVIVLRILAVFIGQSNPLKYVFEIVFFRSWEFFFHVWVQVYNKNSLCKALILI